MKYSIKMMRICFLNIQFSISNIQCRSKKIALPRIANRNILRHWKLEIGNSTFRLFDTQRIFRMRFLNLSILLLAAGLMLSCNDTPPKMNSIVFSSSRDGNSNIYIMNEYGKITTPLLQWPGNEWNPRWIPNTSKIIFFSDSLGANTVFSLDLRTKAVEQFCTIDYDDPFMAVSPDGAWIAYHFRDDSGNVDIYRSRLDGSERERLTEHPAKDYKPAFSPDGNQISFTSYRDGNAEVYVMNLAGGALKNISNHPADDANATFSPDGKSLLFRSGREGGGNQEIYTKALTGENVRRLTHHPGWELVASWSLDGQDITFGSNRDGNWEIYRVKATGGELLRLTDHPGFDGDPVWVLY